LIIQLDTPTDSNISDSNISCSAVIEVAHLTKRYGKQTSATLEDISFKILSGQRVALLGANGAGKSTLFRILLGLIPFDTGEIKRFGVETSGQRGHKSLRWFRCQVGFIPQNHGLSPTLCVLSNVLHGRLGKGKTWRRCFQSFASEGERNEAIQCLDRFGLVSKALSLCGQLSGGESQRVTLARAFFGRPRLFIADEPVASLDPSIANEMMEALSQQAAETSATLLFATHNLEHAMKFSDRILAIGDRRIVMDQATQGLTLEELRAIYD